MTSEQRFRRLAWQFAAVTLMVAVVWTITWWRIDRLPPGQAVWPWLAGAAALSAALIYGLFSLVGRQNEAALVTLSSQQQLLETLLESLDIGVMVIDRNRQFLVANQSAMWFFALTFQPIGRRVGDVVTQHRLLEAVERTFADGTRRKVVIDLRDAANLRRVLRVYCVLVLIGEEPAVVIKALDDSENRQIEEMRREFVANASHELKTPLAAILGYSETVQVALEDDPESAKLFLTRIHDECRRMERLIAEMMTLARAQAGAEYLRPVSTDLDSILTEAISSSEAVAEAKGVRIQHRRNPDAKVFIHGDREATLTIANNVIGNAIRYTPEGGRVIVWARSVEDYGVLVVRDSGIGIPEHEQERIFERFYRAEHSRTQSSAGTGLGLAIVKNLTQAQGGHIRLYSRPQQGSTFEIHLPLASAPAGHQIFTEV